RVWVAESTTVTIFPVTFGGSHSASDRKDSHFSSAMFIDQDSRLWNGLTGDGGRYVPSPSAETYLHSASVSGVNALSGKVVGSALKDREGNMWFGTNAGLDRFRQSDLVNAELPSAAYNFALAIDSEGAVWAGSMNRNAMRLAGKHL